MEGRSEFTPEIWAMTCRAPTEEGGVSGRTERTREKTQVVCRKYLQNSQYIIFSLLSHLSDFQLLTNLHDLVAFDVLLRFSSK